VAVITWPGLKVATFRWKKANQAIVFRSVFGAQALEGAAPLWEVELTGVPQKWADANLTVAFLESLDGFRNQIALWNLVQPVPRGTMRGDMALKVPAAQGANALTIAAGVEQASRTLLTGDLIGLGAGLTQQVVRVTADARANAQGDIVVGIGTPLRNAFPAGAAVVWDRPKALFRQRSLNDGIEYVPVIGQPWALSLIEDWRP
jgi:hypothetical protein